MDAQKQRKISENYKKMLNDDQVKSFSDIRHIIERIANKPDDILDENDYINFDPSYCLLNCDGACCINSSHIRVTPVDIDLAYESDFARSTGLNKVNFIKKYFEIFTGTTSNVPMGIVKKLKRDNLNFCVFLIPIKKVITKDFDDFKEITDKLIDEKQHEKLFEELEIRSEFGLICALGQENKPNVCKLSPLGRFTATDENKMEDFYIVSNNCGATNTNMKIKIKDFLKCYNSTKKETDEYLQKTTDLIGKINSFVGDEQLKDMISSVLIKKLIFDEGHLIDRLNSANKLIELFIEDQKRFYEIERSNGISAAILFLMTQFEKYKTLI